MEDKNQFLYEVPADTVVEEVIRQIIVISNLRRKIQRLKACIDELAAHGPVSEHASHDAKGRAADMEGKGVQWASQDPAAPRTGASEDPVLTQTHHVPPVSHGQDSKR